MTVPKPERKNYRIESYITKTKYINYKLQLLKKDMTMAEAVREGLKLLFENKKEENSDFTKMYDMMLEVLSAKVQTYEKPSSYMSKLIKKDWKEGEEDWDEARKKKKEEIFKKEAQTPVHSKFMKAVIPELKKAQMFENYGLDKVPEDVLSEERPKTDLSSYAAWKIKVEERKELEVS